LEALRSNTGSYALAFHGKPGQVGRSEKGLSPFVVPRVTHRRYAFDASLLRLAPRGQALGYIGPPLRCF